MSQYSSRRGSPNRRLSRTNSNANVPGLFSNLAPIAEVNSATEISLGSRNNQNAQNPFTEEGYGGRQRGGRNRSFIIQEGQELEGVNYFFTHRERGNMFRVMWLSTEGFMNEQETPGDLIEVINNGWSVFPMVDNMSRDTSGRQIHDFIFCDRSEWEKMFDNFRIDLQADTSRLKQWIQDLRQAINNLIKGLQYIRTDDSIGRSEYASRLQTCLRYIKLSGVPDDNDSQAGSYIDYSTSKRNAQFSPGSDRGSIVYSESRGSKRPQTDSVRGPSRENGNGISNIPSNANTPSRRIGGTLYSEQLADEYLVRQELNDINQTNDIAAMRNGVGYEQFYYDSIARNNSNRDNSSAYVEGVRGENSHTFDDNAGNLINDESFSEFMEEDGRDLFNLNGTRVKTGIIIPPVRDNYGFFIPTNVSLNDSRANNGNNNSRNQNGGNNQTNSRGNIRGVNATNNQSNNNTNNRQIIPRNNNNNSNNNNNNSNNNGRNFRPYESQDSRSFLNPRDILVESDEENDSKDARDPRTLNLPLFDPAEELARLDRDFGPAGTNYSPERARQLHLSFPILGDYNLLPLDYEGRRTITKETYEYWANILHRLSTGVKIDRRDSLKSEMSTRPIPWFKSLSPNTNFFLHSWIDALEILKNFLAGMTRTQAQVFFMQNLGICIHQLQFKTSVNALIQFRNIERDSDGRAIGYIFKEYSNELKTHRVKIKQFAEQYNLARDTLVTLDIESKIYMVTYDEYSKNHKLRLGSYGVSQPVIANLRTLSTQE